MTSEARKRIEELREEISDIRKIVGKTTQNEIKLRKKILYYGIGTGFCAATTIWLIILALSLPLIMG